MLNVKVVPKSATTRLGGIINHSGNNYWKIYLNSLPEKGKANKELISFLATKLQTSKNNISIVNGLTSFYKTLQVSDISANFPVILKSIIFGQ